MKVLVTGAAGFIASHVTDRLLKRGHDILAIDNLSSGKRENLAESVELQVVDICSEKAAELISDFKPHAVFHLAAQVSVRNSVDDPFHDAKTNILGTLNVFGAAAKAGAEAFIYSSTGGAIYGEQIEYPARESHPTRPVSPYGASKLAADNYLHFFAHDKNIRCVALRYANVFGPRQDPHGEAGVVAIFTKALLKGKTPTINGDGRQTRDYVFVSDVADANILALEKDVAGAVNIATGIETGVNEIFQKLKNIIGADVPENHGPAKRGEQMRSVLCIDKAKEVLGWQPKVSFDEGLEKTVEFFKSAE